MGTVGLWGGKKKTSYEKKVQSFSANLQKKRRSARKRRRKPANWLWITLSVISTTTANGRSCKPGGTWCLNYAQKTSGSNRQYGHGRLLNILRNKITMVELLRHALFTWAHTINALEMNLKSLLFML